MAVAAASASLSSSVRSWRTAFLTLRDETLYSPHPVSIVRFLDHLIFSQSETLIPAVTDLPRHEVTSDVMFLLELAGMAADSKRDDDTIHMFVQLLDMVQDVSHTMSLDLSSSNWALMLNCFQKMVDIIFAKAGRTELLLGNGVVVRALKQCLEVLRYFTRAYQRKWLQTENTELLHFLLNIVALSHTELSFLASSTGHQRCIENGRNPPKCSNLWDVQATSFLLIGEVFSRMGSSLPDHAWQSTILVLKKVIDTLASRNTLVEDHEMARFYTSLLQCLHLVLIDPKGPLIDHVAGFVALLRMFFIYGLSRGFQLKGPVAGGNGEDYSRSFGKNDEESGKIKTGVYRPPHLRKKDVLKSKQQQYQGVSCSPNLGSVRVDYTSSESDYSDSDGSTKCGDNNRFTKARVASIICIQDLCRADPKSFTAQWTMLLPTADVLKSRKYEASMMTCLLFDPSMKVRTVTASALATMLEAPTSLFLQVAEYKESTKCGSFTPLSSSLGQILLQLHTGILYLIQCETHGGLLASLFKILMLLVSSTPYSRMPGELLPTVISCLHTRIDQGFPCRGDQTSLLAAAFNCLSSALSASSSSIKVRDIIVEELSKGCFEVERSSGLLATLFRYSQPLNNSSVCLEALQALRAVPHNHPDLAFACWNQVSSTVSEHLRLPLGANNLGLGSVGEKTATAATKVLDESLRAISGFQGTDDIFNDKMADAPFTSDYLRAKKVSSAPSFVAINGVGAKTEKEACQLGIKQWSEAIEKHMPLVLCHPSAMVRAAAVTCFAGLTDSVFSSLPKEKQEFIVESSIQSSLKDEVSSVKSSACRAIGVIACFPSIFQSAEILGKFAHAADVNSRDSLVMVRVTASWALANICDSLSHHVNTSTDLILTSHILGLLKECALRLTKDGDKIKANAVRALGNLARLMRFTSGLSCKNYDAVPQLERAEVQNILQKREMPNLPENVLTEDLSSLAGMVQAFISCVSTGNVKVQWNVCHALSNLFLNDTLKLQDMDWAPSVFSILLLLLRDSPNFKIKIQAAAALAVPVKVTDYGTSFSDVLQGVLHAVENLSSDQITPSSFKYWIALENQVTSTMLHLLGLASGTDSPQVAGFIAKKALFLEEWLGRLCSSVGETSTSSSTELLAENVSKLNQKKEVILRALRSVIKILEIGKDSVIERKFVKLVNSIV